MLTACGPPLPVNDIPPNLPLNADGLPPHFARCVTNVVEKKTQVYDVFYLCRGELITYVVRTNGLNPTEKADLLAEYEKRGMKHAHEMAVARWGEKSRPPISQPAVAKPTPIQPPPPSEPTIIWGPPMPAPPSEGLRF